ncbi:hypothetical protein CaPhCPX_gp070 [Campylobacter phage CPX]|uniref:Uncharacterized protein n=2 Tax=Fletchervirus TaxID=1636618 RepID=G8GIY2_9CAUD|nr:hypothetical protein CaPhCPX_gp070 [Campylobacter phage CPX]AET34367.1 hypothetical protein [Campylobacter phage CPX]AGS81240.1 hypothetical protein [Campylobacter phage CP8]
MKLSNFKMCKIGNNYHNIRFAFSDKVVFENCKIKSKYDTVKKFISLNYNIPIEKIDKETELFFFSIKLLCDIIELCPNHKKEIEDKVGELCDFREYQLES